MKLIIRFIGLIFIISPVLQNTVHGQTDTISRKKLMNTVWINIFNPIIDTKYIVIGYERILKNNQSFTFNIGRLSLPKFGSTDSDFANVQKEYKDWGLNTSVDYRFYLGKLNKNPAPRGVYLAPFYSFNYFERENKWILDSDSFDGELTTDFSIQIHTIGGQIGYQFVFWRRLAVDLVLFGPGVGVYSFKTKLGTTLSPDDEAKFFEAMNEMIKDKFPGYDLVIESGDFEKKGSESLTTLGFRYMIHIGFRF